jgi:hypothetical protein
MVDYTAFATAFLEGSAKIINERKDKNEDYEDKQRELAEKNKGIITRRGQIVGQALSLAKQAEGLFATPEMISAALDSGPGGLQNLVAQLTEGKSKQGKRWNAEAAKTIASLPEGYKVPEGDLQARIRQTYGLPQASLGSTAAPDRSWWERATGKGGKEAVRAELDTESFVDGYSVMDVNEAAAQAEYQSLTSGTFVNYVQPKMFNADDLATEVSTLELMMERAKGTKAYVKAATELKRIEAQDAVITEEAKLKRDVELQQARADMDAAQRSFLADFVQNRAASFTGGNYFDEMGSTIAAYLGEDFLSSMDITNPSVASVGGGTGDDPVSTDMSTAATDVEAAGGEVKVDPAAKTAVYTHPSLIGGSIKVEANDAGQPVAAMINIDGEEFTVDGEALESVWSEITNIKPISAGRELNLENINTDLAAISPDEMPTLDPTLTTKEERDALSKDQLKAAGLKYSPLGKLLQHLPDGEERDRREAAILLKRDADPEKWYKIMVPGMNLNRPYKIKGSSLFYIPDTELAQYGGSIVSELAFDEDLPKKTFSERKVKKSFGTEGADKGVTVEGSEAEEAITADGSVRPKARPEGLMKEPEAEPEGAAVEVAAEELIKEHGRDILQFLRDEGFTSEDTEEDIAQGLADWYANNSANLSLPSAPMDKGPITYVLKAALG